MVSVLIINYNTADLIADCVESVLKQQGIDFEIIVIDNNSSDQSLAVLQNFGDKIKLIANQENLGFGKANNQGFKISNGEYLFLLNPDAKFVSSLDLKQAVDYLIQHPQCGTAGTAILNKSSELTISTDKYYPRQKQTKSNFAALPGEYASVLGASMVMRRDVFEKINGFDEDYFLYVEEIDLCLRIRQLGYTVDYIKDAKVQHIGGASERKNRPEEVALKKKTGKYLFYQKHYSKLDARRLIKHDLKHSQIQLLRLKILNKFLGLNQKNKTNYATHLAILGLAQKFLNIS